MKAAFSEKLGLIESNKERRTSRKSPGNIRITNQTSFDILRQTRGIGIDFSILDVLTLAGAIQNKRALNLGALISLLSFCS